MTHPAARAFLALWNSIGSPQVQAEYETWHTFEHVPERVGLPGFLEARRYRAHEVSVDQPPHYFTCYWLAAIEALATPPYREVFSQPTPWSARMRTELRDFFRLPCTLSGAYGASTAAQLACVHFRGDAALFAAHAEAALAQLVDQAAVVCAHWGTVAPAQDFPIANVAAPPAEGGTDFVVMLQGIDLATLRERTHALVQALAPAAVAVSAPTFFELLSQVRQDELSSPLDARQPARPSLFQAFQHSGDMP